MLVFGTGRLGRSIRRGCTNNKDYFNTPPYQSRDLGVGGDASLNGGRVSLDGFHERDKTGRPPAKLAFLSLPVNLRSEI